MSVTNRAPDSEAPSPEPVWNYRGYNLRPSEFTTAMVHFYRAEIQRSNTWRNRLDNTTNWAVVAAGAAISFALSSPQNHYGVIVLNTLLVTLFLWIEARRYRYYELWSYRARLMETDLFAAMLVPPFTPSPEWAETLASSLLQPEFPITMWEAFGRRFRRNYLWILLILGLAWALKSSIHPVPATSWSEFIGRSALGSIPGEVMVAAGLIYNGVLFAVGLITAGLRAASGEVLPKYDTVARFGDFLRAAAAQARADTATALPRGRRRQQALALIITGQPEPITQKILSQMRRGATVLHGEGGYSGQARTVLLVAVTVTEIAQLKALVRAQDSHAFVIVSPAQNVFGRGFESLDD